jgi:hypothetical protein
VLYTALAGQLETFLRRQQQCGRPTPAFVEDEFRSYLECGIAEGPNTGQRVKTFGRDSGSGEADGLASGGSRSVMVAGFSVHAGVGIRARQRQALEKLCRYMAHPPLANERLLNLPDGRIELSFENSVEERNHACDF